MRSMRWAKSWRSWSQVAVIATSGCLFGCGSTSLRIDVFDADGGVRNGSSAARDPNGLDPSVPQTNPGSRNAGATTPVPAAPASPGLPPRNDPASTAGMPAFPSAGRGAADAGVGVVPPPMLMPTGHPTMPAIDAGAAGSGAPPVVDSATSYCLDGAVDGDVTVLSSMDIDRLKGCRSINGNLRIGANYVDTLRGLDELEFISGLLAIEPEAFGSFNGVGSAAAPTKLRSLVGLGRLAYVSTLQLSGLSLTSLEGLSQLQNVDNVVLFGLDELRDLKGLEQTTWQAASIGQNANLRSLDGLRVLPQEMEVDLIGNPKLENIAALKVLEQVGQITLSGLPALLSLDGLQRLVNIGSLTIDSCNQFKDLSGLSARSIVTSLSITQNLQLRNLNGLALAAPAQAVVLMNNPQLESLAGLLGPSGTSLGVLQLSGLPVLKSLSDLKGLVEAQSVLIHSCDGITDLTGLGQLKHVNQLQVSDCLNLKSLSGADALESVESELWIDALPGVTSLQGFTALSRAGSLYISNMHGLPNLQGLDRLTSVNALGIASTPLIQNLKGLEKITDLHILALDNNAALLTLEGAPSATPQFDLFITANPLLQNLQGLGSLQTAEQLLIVNNPSLTALLGLEHLTSSSWLSINSNTGLTSLHALSALTSITGGLDISANRRLPECEVDWLLKRIKAPAQPPGVNGPQGTCEP
jgi:hypothetical protein